MRRVHVVELSEGEMMLAEGEAHHVRDVLRLARGDEVEVFDDGGRMGVGRISSCSSDAVVVTVDGAIREAGNVFEWTIAAAVPKGSRADWMIEKLSELGTSAFVPLATARGVVEPRGRGKRERWMRIAAEAAKQSRRVGVMRIEELVETGEFLKRFDGAGWYLSTGAEAIPIGEAIEKLPAGATQLTLLVGPEGGWTAEELGSFEKTGLTGVSLGRTILRVETAAVAAAAVVAAVVAPWLDSPSTNGTGGQTARGTGAIPEDPGKEA